MAQIFPKKTNLLVFKLLAVKLMGAGIIALGVWYYFSPKFIEVGYRPKQPVAYSHKLHAGDLGIDCRYCHTNVEKSSFAGVPPTQTCMNCHKMIATQSEKLALVRASWAEQKPLRWTKVHDLPDFAYFPHNSHIRAGVGCQSCHGDVASMEVVTKSQPLSMRWCLECHRNPAPHLRPFSEITNTKYNPPNKLEIGKKLLVERRVKPPEDCTACHR